MPISTIPINLLNKGFNYRTSRFEVASKEPTCPFGDGLAKDIIISRNPEELRGSPRVVSTTTGNLVGRGIANPMSERTRGFEILLNGCC